MDENFGVSVIIATYNQKAFIADAIEGALKQKTNFRFEIIIHDDASTDGTTDIIMDYVKRFPETIIAIIEEKNMYSFPEKCTEKILKQARGRYLACCDGDDYWIDKNKLQMQFDFLEKNEDYAMCVHNTYVIDGNQKKIFSSYKTGELQRSEVIEKAGAMFHSSSHFFRRELWLGTPGKYDCFDLGRCLWCSDQGRIMYYDNVMSVYRLHTRGSWSVSMRQVYALISDLVSRVSYYEKFDNLTNNRWHESVKKVTDGILGHLFEVLRPYYRQFSFKRKCAILLGMIADLLGVWSWMKALRTILKKIMS